MKLDWLNEQAKDEEIIKVVECINSQAGEDSWNKIKNGSRWYQEKRELYISDGILKHGNNRVVCPEHMKEEVLQLHHDSPFSGHRAYDPTLASIIKRYYWNFLPSQVKNYCQSCDMCQRFNYACLHNRAPLKSIVVSRPWQMLGLDVIGPFKQTIRGNKYVIIGIDHWTKFIELVPTITFDAKTTALFVFNNIICRYGMVEQILSDQGVNFESHLFKHLCSLLGTEKLHSSTYHAAGNGMAERVIKTIKPNIAKLVNSNHDDWDLFVQMAASAYNNTYHASIKCLHMKPSSTSSPSGQCYNETPITFKYQDKIYCGFHKGTPSKC